MEIKLKNAVVQVEGIQPTEIETYLQKRIEELRPSTKENQWFLGGYVLVGEARELHCEAHIDLTVGFGNLMRTATLYRGAIIEYDRLFKPSKETLSSDLERFLANTLPENLPEDAKKPEIEVIDLVKHPHRLIKFGIRLRFVGDELYHVHELLEDYHQLLPEKKEELKRKYEQLVKEKGITNGMDYKKAIDALLELIPIVAEEEIDEKDIRNL